jgi:hypothetical protein
LRVGACEGGWVGACEGGWVHARWVPVSPYSKMNTSLLHSKMNTSLLYSKMNTSELRIIEYKRAPYH